MTDAPKTVDVETATVACDGGTLGHPKVYLEIREEGFVDCPYCGCRYVLKAQADAH